MKDVKAQLYVTVHGSRKSAAEIADECGISASYLYRTCLEGDSGCRFPLELLLPLMNATGDYRILDHLNARCGRVTAKLPRVAKLKRRDPQVVNEIQQGFSSLMGLVLRFFESPSDEALVQVKAQLHAHLCEMTSLGRAVETFRQREMF